MNTMADLRRECSQRMRRALHGREIDVLDNPVKTPHMLGIVPVGGISTRKAEEETLLDPNHEFWVEYEKEITTKNAAKQEIESAIRSLRKDDIFRMTYPYGEEADIIYCEVDEIELSSDTLLPTHCTKCDEKIDATLGIAEDGGYEISVEIDCPHCEYSSVLESNLVRK